MALAMQYTFTCTCRLLAGYESGFESHAFAGELEIEELAEYFRECDLYPPQTDIDEAFDIVFRGSNLSRQPSEFCSNIPLNVDFTCIQTSCSVPTRKRVIPNEAHTSRVLNVVFHFSFFCTM